LAALSVIAFNLLAVTAWGAGASTKHGFTGLIGYARHMTTSLLMGSVVCDHSQQFDCVCCLLGVLALVLGMDTKGLIRHARHMTTNY
jgi:hypothetical protein